MGKEQKLLAGVEALAKHLGPVAGMFEEALYLLDSTVPLRADVKQLSPKVFKQLLASEALQLQLENKAYALLVAWLRQSPHVVGEAQRMALFKELVPLLRYHDMTRDYLANVMCECPLMKDSGLGLSVMRSAFV